MEKDKLVELHKLYKNGLLEKTLPFWLEHTIDKEHGGFLNQLDPDGYIRGTDKPVWVLNRFTWLMSLLYNEIEEKEEWLNVARHGIDFIEKHCFDSDGRMFFLVTKEGLPLIKRRYLFTETFGVIAFSEYGKAAKDDSKIQKAKDIFKLICHYMDNPQLLPQKIFPSTRKMKSHAMSMIMISTSQQMRKVDNDPMYDKMIDRCLEDIFEKFMHEDVKALLETVNEDGSFIDSPDGRNICPGHAIESAWFILHEAMHRNDKSLIDQACKIIDWSLDWGWDKEYGGIYYFVDCKGKCPDQYEHDMKLWWPHNEAIYATLLAWHLTGNEKYSNWYQKVHDWAYSHFPDNESGEWFKYLHRTGTVSHHLIGNLRAGPFHFPRMQFNCFKLLEKLL